MDSISQRHAIAYSFFQDVWIHQNPYGTLFFLSWLGNMHRIVCEDCKARAKEES